MKIPVSLKNRALKLGRWANRRQRAMSGYNFAAKTIAPVGRLLFDDYRTGETRVRLRMEVREEIIKNVIGQLGKEDPDIQCSKRELWTIYNRQLNEAALIQNPHMRSLDIVKICESMIKHGWFKEALELANSSKDLNVFQKEHILSVTAVGYAKVGLFDEANCLLFPYEDDIRFVIHVRTLIVIRKIAYLFKKKNIVEATTGLQLLLKSGGLSFTKERIANEIVKAGISRNEVLDLFKRVGVYFEFLTIEQHIEKLHSHLQD